MPAIRIFREFKAHIVRYLILIVILAASLSLVEGNVMSSGSINDQMEEYFKEFHAEDGEFVTITELTPEQESELAGKNIDLQRLFYSDYNYGDDAVVRIYKTRDHINEINVIKGEEPDAWNEVLVENRFAKANNISTGDVLSVAGSDLTVTGIGTVPDYVSVKKNRTDIRTDDRTFGVLFVNQDTCQALLDTGSAIQNEVHEYAYILKGNETTNDLKKYLNDQAVPEFLSFQHIDSILISITDVNDNERMTGYKTDVDTNLSVSILLACLLAGLIAFIIAVFMMHTIDQESSEIGTLYALGVKRSEIKRQYVLLPVFVLIAGGVAGTLSGMFMNGVALENVAQSYSFPEITAHFYPVALLYGIVIPVVFGYIINTLILNRKLRQ